MLLTLLFLVVVVLPVVLWFLYIRHADRSEPEPGRLMWRCIYVGLASTIVAAIFETIIFPIFGFPDDPLSAAAQAMPLALALGAFLAGPIEELCNYIVLRYSVYFNTAFNQVFDGAVYGMTIGLSFAFFENIGYFFTLHQEEPTLVFLVGVAIRGLISVLVHVTATGITGLYVGWAKFSPTGRRSLMIEGVFYASLLHGSFNIIMQTIPFGLFISAPLAVIAFLIFKRTWSRPDVRMVWQYMPPAPLPPAQRSNI